MVLNKRIKRLLFPINVFDKEQPALTATRDVLQGILSATKAELEPIYILSPSLSDLTSGAEIDSLDPWKSKAQALLENMAQALLLPGQLPPVVVVEITATIGAAVKALNNHGLASNADLIVLGTHGRSGFSRLMSGSFAETLLTEASLPVLVVGPHVVAATRFDSILFASDFDDKSQDVFEQVMAFAGQLGAKITLFSSVHRNATLAASETAALNKEKERRQARAETLAAGARKHGLSAEVSIEVTSKKVDEAILEAVTRFGARLIAMSAQRGPVASVLIGSVVRPVIRHCSCPVWVLREGAL